MKLTTVVKNDKGKYFYIDTCFCDDVKMYETMVFNYFPYKPEHVEIPKSQARSSSDLYMTRCFTADESIFNHDIACSLYGEYVCGDKAFKEVN